MEKNSFQKGEGFVIRVQGAIVDVKFNDEAPDIYEALNITMKDGSTLVLETMFQMDNFENRTIALGSTDGLKRGDNYKNKCSNRGSCWRKNIGKNFQCFRKCS